MKFNGKKIPTSSALPPIVGRSPIGKAVSVEVMRNNKRKTLRVKIEQLPENEEMKASKGSPSRLVDDRLAIEVADLDDKQREQYGIDKGGVIVVSLEQGAASSAGLRRGDVIMIINNQKIETAKQFLDIAKDLPEDKAIPVLVQRGEGAIFLALRIETDE